MLSIYTSYLYIYWILKIMKPKSSSDNNYLGVKRMSVLDIKKTVKFVVLLYLGSCLTLKRNHNGKGSSNKKIPPKMLNSGNSHNILKKIFDWETRIRILSSLTFLRNQNPPSAQKLFLIYPIFFFRQWPHWQML